MKISVINHGTFALDGGAMFGVVPKVLWSKKYQEPDEKNRVQLVNRSLLIQTADKNILIDTGNGSKLDDKSRTIYGIHNDDHPINDLLQPFGIDKSDISDVILTHLHFDHVGGATEYIDGSLKATFPNAMYHVQEKHLTWANSPSEKDRASFIKDNFQPLIAEKRLNTVDGACQILSNIELIPVSGHTDSMQMVKICTDTHTILYTSDLIPTSAHVSIPYIMGYDNYPMTVIDEKKKYLELAVQNNWVLCFEHDYSIAAATIKVDEKGRYSLNELIDIENL